MKLNKQKILFIAVIFFWFAQYVYIPYQTPCLTMIQTSTSFIGIIIGTYGISQMVLRLPVGLLANYRNKHKMIMLIGSLSSGCASLFRIIFNNGIGFLSICQCNVDFFYGFIYEFLSKRPTNKSHQFNYCR